MSQLIYVIIFLIVLLIINSVLSQKAIEHFYIEKTPLPMSIFKFTGRDLVFPYLGESKLTASDRAIYEKNISTMPAGQCPFPNDISCDESFAVVQENGVYYSLKKACMALNITGYRFDNNEQMITVTCALDSTENVNNMAKFLLVNPLFVEIVNSTNNSIAYIPQPFKSNYTEQGFYFTNSAGYNDVWAKGFNPSSIDIRLRVAVPNGKGSCDTTFDYSSYETKKRQLTVDDMKRIKRTGLLNMWVYYLDDLSSSFQTTNRTLPIEVKNNNTIVIFDKKFKEWSSDPYKITSYNFMNILYNMYNTFTIPVLSFSFSFMVKKSLQNSTTLLKAYVANNFISGWQPCSNNVMQITVDPQEDYIELQFSIGDGSDCGYKTWFAPPAKLWLPWLTDNTPVNVTAVFGINQKHIFAEWKDINKGDSGKKFAYAKSQQNFFEPPFDTCTRYDENMHREINNFTKIFGSKKFTPETRPKLENMLLNWNKDYISEITNISIGYENLYNKFATPK